MKTAVITGATSGIGFEVCKALLKLDYKVIGVGHTLETCEAAKNRILSEIPGADIRFAYGELMHQREVNRVAAEVAELLDDECGGKLDVLINNAGCVRSLYATTEEGYEQQFATNHLAGFLLTYRLFSHLKRGKGIVIMTGSNSHKLMKINWKDVMFKKRYNPLLVYKQSRLCNMLFAYELNRRYKSSGIRAYVVDPGLVKTDIGNKKTGFLVNAVWTLRKKHGACASVPARTYAFLCELRPDDGLYYHACKPKAYSRQVNCANSERLFKLSEQLCGIEFGG